MAKREGDKYDSDFEGSDTEFGDKDEVKIDMASYLRLRDSAKRNRSKPPPSKYIFDTLVVDGEACLKSRRAEVKFEFQINVLDAKMNWVSVPILTCSLAVLTSDINYQGVASSDSKDKDKKASKNKRNPKERAYVGIKDGMYCLMCTRPGKYVLKLSCHVPFASQQQQNVSVQLPRCVQTSLAFRIPKNGVTVKLEPAIGETKLTESEKSTEVTCDVPPTTQLNIQWRDKVPELKVVEKPAAEKDEKREKKKIIVTANQNALHVVGEGVIRTHLHYDVSVTHGARSVFEIGIRSDSGKEVRVLDVGGRAITRWEVIEAGLASERRPSLTSTAPSSDGFVDLAVDAPKRGGAAAGAGASLPPPSSVEMSERAPSALSSAGSTQGVWSKVLKVWVEYGIEGDYKLAVKTEMSMISNCSEVQLPAFNFLQIDREQGRIGIEGQTNVEINEISRMSLARIDVGELDKSVARLANNPVLHAYKFLITPYSLHMNVKRHADASSLVAVIEAAWLESTQSEDCRLNRIVMRVRNSQKQFVRVTLPHSKCEIWSATVDGTTVKPAIDRDSGEVMVPLKKSSGATGRPTPAFQVQLVYLEPEQEKMKGRGTLCLDFAKFDVPVQRMYNIVYLPTDFHYGEFRGDVREVKVLRENAPGDDGKAKTHPQPHQGGMRQQRVVQREQQQNACNDGLFDDDFDDEDDEGNEEEEDAPMAQMQMQTNLYDRRSSLTNCLDAPPLLVAADNKAGMEAGVVPVQIQSLQVGTRFIFERILVEGKEIKLQVDYAEKKKPKWSQRQAGDKTWLQYLFCRGA